MADVEAVEERASGDDRGRRGLSREIVCVKIECAGKPFPPKKKGRQGNEWGLTVVVWERREKRGERGREARPFPFAPSAPPPPRLSFFFGGVRGVVSHGRLGRRGEEGEEEDM